MRKKSRKKSSIKESVGNTEAVRSLKRYGYRAYKISDVQGTRFTETKPCDIIACSPKGRYVAIEGKMIKKWSGFSSKALRPNQRAELDGATIKRGGRAFIFLYVRIKADPKKKQPRVHKLVVFDWKEYRSKLDVGIPITMMEGQYYGVWLKAKKDKEGKVYYNLSKLLSKRFKCN